MSTRNLRWSGLGLSVAVIAAAALHASPAQAATTGSAEVVYGTQVVYLAAAGKVNRVTLTRSGNTVMIDDRVKIRPGAGCQRVGRDVTRVRCTTSDAPRSIRVRLGDRDDVLDNRSGVRLLANAGAGRDTVHVGSGSSSVYGSSGNDRLIGGAGHDHLVGGSGADRLYGLAGSDRLRGGNGNDRLYGGAGRDRFEGGAGNDSMWGQAGNDSFSEATWKKSDGLGADRMFGGAGVDTVDYSGRSRGVTADADGAKRDDGGRGEHDTIGADVEDLYGGDGNDVLRGNAAPNTLSGGPGNDRLYGRGGNDELFSGIGNDRLYGQGGDDRLRAGRRGTALLDGGANATERGDVCLLGTAKGRTVNCEWVNE